MPLAEILRLLGAISEPNRLRILAVLSRGRMCVCELCAALRLKQSVMSQHLRVLRDLGLVAHRKDGLWVNYELSRDAFRGPSGRVLEAILAEAAKDGSIRKDRDAAAKADRAALCAKAGGRP